MVNRRAFLKGSAAAALTLGFGARFGYAWRDGGALAPHISIPPLRPGPGLPLDWQFVTPRQWAPVDLQIFNTLSPGNAFSQLPAQTEIAGTRLSASGEVEIGSLDPEGESVLLEQALSDVVGPANERLKLDALNADFNPLSSRVANRQDVIGPFSRPEEIFFGRLFVPVRHLMEKAFEASGFPDATTRPLLDALSATVVINTPAHQFRIGDTLGNRIVFYNGSLKPGHQTIDRLAHSLKKQNMRMIKMMVHLDGAAQGGTPKSIVVDGVGGATHVGGFSAGYDNGNPIAVKSDWPSNYGWLNDENRTYNAHLLAIDYGGGTKAPLPSSMAAAYCHNADMWDCCAAMLVPFANGDPNPAWRDYQYNPLEVYNQGTARDVAIALANFDSAAFLRNHGAFYCAEGQFVIANLGPQEDERGGTLLKRSRFGNSEFGRRIENFSKAPRYAGMTEERRRQHPEIGWNHLNYLGPRNGGISNDQFNALKRTDRTGVYLEWLPEEIKGWQSYGTRNAEGLIARPMTVATMAWGLFRRYMPRERVANAIVGEFRRASSVASDQIKSAMLALTQGRDPESPAGRAVLAGIATKAATGLLLGLLESEEMRTRLLEQAGFKEVSNEADKARINAAYGDFIDILKNADYSTQDKFDRALLEADRKLASLVVSRDYYNPVTSSRTPTKSTLMLYAAPACFGMWAQFPLLAETNCIRYVVTAMHTDQSK